MIPNTIIYLRKHNHKLPTPVNVSIGLFPRLRLAALVDNASLAPALPAIHKPSDIKLGGRGALGLEVLEVVGYGGKGHVAGQRVVRGPHV